MRRRWRAGHSAPITPPRGCRSTQCVETRALRTRKRLRLLPRCKVTALGQAVVVDQPRIRVLHPALRRRVDLVRKHAHGHRNGHVLRLKEVEPVPPVQPGRRNARAGDASATVSRSSQRVASIRRRKSASCASVACTRSGRTAAPAPRADRAMPATGCAVSASAQARRLSEPAMAAAAAAPMNRRRDGAGGKDIDWYGCSRFRGFSSQHY